MRFSPRLPTGLRWRLSASVAAVVLICTAVSFFAVYRGTGTQLHHQVDSEITGDLDELARAASAGAAGTRRYLLAQPFRATSTLQFVLITGPRRGAKTVTVANRPELFGQLRPDNGETPTEQAAENRLSHQLLTERDGYSTLSLPDVGNLRLRKRTLTLAGGTRLTVGVGEPLASVAHAQRGVARAFILAGLLALVAALAASFLIGTRFTLPLRRMAAVAAKVDAGDLHPRIHDVGRRGDELRLLAETFNHMLDRLTDAFASQRAFLADASHELRTPLTVIRGQLEALAAQPQPPAAEVRRVERLAQAEIARIARLVDDLLLLAKAEQAEFLRPQPIELAPYVHELWDGVTLLAPRRFELGDVPAGTLLADPDRLAQALRNLLANAIAHTAPDSGLVRLDVHRFGPESLRFLVSDNGPGIPPAERLRVFERFHRTDAARDRASGGTGLGLAIVRAIAEAHGGHVRVGEPVRMGEPIAEARGAGVPVNTPPAGARIELELPHFAPDVSIRVEHTEDTGLPSR
ncbi:MAG TPA: ATP-binding protein [Solirubrobacteraceae bacterium]|jgi:signal transduction histidine kinase